MGSSLSPSPRPSLSISLSPTLSGESWRKVCLLRVRQGRRGARGLRVSPEAQPPELVERNLEREVMKAGWLSWGLIYFFVRWHCCLESKIEILED